MQSVECLRESSEQTGFASLDAVAFLRGALDGNKDPDFRIIETHMSWVFLAGDRAYKLKKAVRSAYLDFSTIVQRERACRAEVRLNQRLAPGIYLGIAPILASPQGLSLTGSGRVVDWLVIMRRLDLALALDNVILTSQISSIVINRISDLLSRFYRKAPRCAVVPETYLSRWRGRVRANRAILFDKRFDLPRGVLFRIERALHRYLTECGDVLVARVTAGTVREGHGDLRPEHIWLGPTAAVIDCLEFNAELREVDPLDELAYLQIECERLGAGWAGRRIEALVSRRLAISDTEGLSSFYRCYRASLRARLALAHLLDAKPRTPEKWKPLAKIYLQVSDQNARRIERHLARRKSVRHSFPAR
jgi:aminoglycoside phosphotransferase family enzyme